MAQTNEIAFGMEQEEKNIPCIRKINLSRFFTAGFLLTSMVAHGLLRLRYPDEPNRTDQAYTTAAEAE